MHVFCSLLPEGGTPNGAVSGCPPDCGGASCHCPRTQSDWSAAVCKSTSRSAWKSSAASRIFQQAGFAKLLRLVYDTAALRGAVCGCTPIAAGGDNDVEMDGGPVKDENENGSKTGRKRKRVTH